MRILRRYILLTVAALMLSGCFFTGVEGTKTIRDSQTTPRADVSETDPLDTIAPPVFTRWNRGKEFYVIDSQINLLLASATSTLRLEVGDTLHYISAEAENIYGTKPLAFVNFGTRGGATVRLKSGMTMDALRAAHQLPFMVALSVVEQVRAEIVGQELFTTTAQWYDINGDAAQGIKYAKVRVIDIQPGNKVYSLKVLFQYEGKNYFQYVSAGNDAVAFRFSAGGEDPRDIAKVASGGELSRIMLSLKQMMARFTEMPTLVFDEIDTGVSGSVADKMGGMICDMSADMQVFAITHLPQVAAKGKAHYVVEKTYDGQGRPVSAMRRLEGEERVLEVARMLSGSRITEAAIENAKVLLGE